MKEIIDKLLTIQKELNAIVDLPEENLSWQSKFELVFSPNYSRKFMDLIKELNLSFDYYDPDCDYVDDVLAFISAMNNTMSEVQSLSVIFEK